MKLNNVLNIVIISIAVCLFLSCNLDYGSSMISTSLADSKEKGFFLFEYKIDSITIWDKKKTFAIKNVWLEKAHSSTMNAFGKETYTIDDKFNQIVFDIDQFKYFNSGNYLKNWIIQDDKENDGDGQGKMISIILSTKNRPNRIKIIVESLKDEGTLNYGRVKVVEFILKRH